MRGEQGGRPAQLLARPVIALVARRNRVVAAAPSEACVHIASEMAQRSRLGGAPQLDMTRLQCAIRAS
jgi:hypothetical protein